MFLALVIAAWIGQTAPDSVPPLESYPDTIVTTYAVGGRDSRQIRRSMNELRPTAPSGDRHDAVTRWQSRWRMSGRQGRCDPATAQVDFTITVTMPVLEEPERLRGRDRQAWDRYYAALTLHEGNHVRLALAGKSKLESALRAAPDCASMREIGESVMEELAAASVEYDRVTQHGRSEGATFP